MAQIQFKGKSFVQNHHLLVKYHELIPKNKEMAVAEESVRLAHDIIPSSGEPPISEYTVEEKRPGKGTPSILLEEFQEALRCVAPEPGVEVQREHLFRRALPYLGFSRLGKNVISRFQTALKGLIQRGEFG